MSYPFHRYSQKMKVNDTQVNSGFNMFIHNDCQVSISGNVFHSFSFILDFTKLFGPKCIESGVLGLKVCETLV
uniref:Uncharacterized protein n=2 Tax=Anguilla anguilla TaxID=7936 RepID=A0A0E9Q9Z7_ANGAN